MGKRKKSQKKILKFQFPDELTIYSCLFITVYLL